MIPDTDHQITIAIDGFSSCGKSTLANDLANQLGYVHIDSGAMYRAVTLYLLQNQISLHHAAAVDDALQKIEITFQLAGSEVHTFLNNVDVENEIRSIAVSELVSPVAAISAVRSNLVKQQRSMGENKGIVMDGRDIGTVVFPDAELKLFMTASLNVRITRRTLELQDKGLVATREQIERSITERDRIDSSRTDSPLRQADDAIVIDNTNLTRQQQLKTAHNLAIKKILYH